MFPLSQNKHGYTNKMGNNIHLLTYNGRNNSEINNSFSILIIYHSFIKCKILLLYF